ncbi:MAG: HAD-IA family hydrolase, partial [Ruminococcus sp.]|nr:HAD-IA family hydrolase [Ruminococcus sp.]
SLDPKQCVFIDDTQKNVDAAKKLGMKGILCTTQTGDELFEQITALQ